MIDKTKQFVDKFIVTKLTTQTFYEHELAWK